MLEQHDDHCILRYQDENWRITYMDGLGHIAVRNVLFPQLWQVLNLSAVDWAMYTHTAVAALNDALPLWDIELMAREVVECSGGSVGTIYAALRDAYRMGALHITYDEVKRRQAAEREQWAREHPEDDMVI